MKDRFNFKGSRNNQKNMNLWVTEIKGHVSLYSDNLLREINMNRKLRIDSETEWKTWLLPEFIFLNASK